MRKRNQLSMLLAGLGAAGLTMASCNDLSTGQEGEPEGALKITRLTLFDDHVSRDSAIFTDTSAPADCMDPAVKDSSRCVNDPFGDRYGLKKSPPTPDSLSDIRVVFNKLPLTLDGQDLQKISKPDKMPPTEKDFGPIPRDVAVLSCVSGCAGAPATIVKLALTGSELSPDPTVFPYGPALQIVADPDDPVAALEPESEYTVVIKQGLGDRDGNRVDLGGDAPKLLRFNTEPFQVLQVGVGDVDHDPYVYAEPATSYETDVVEEIVTMEMGMEKRYPGVIAIKLNAPVDPSVFKVGTVKATAGAMSIPVKIGVNAITEIEEMMVKKLVCDPGNQRTLYIYPERGSGWGPAGTEVTVTITGADIRDLSQAENHPAGQGKHALKSDIVVTATVIEEPEEYSGLSTQVVAADDDCPSAMAQDMSMPGDMRTGGDMSGDMTPRG
jgi:3D (Asp-Asp-Asp) domain-containing protein